MIGDDFDEEQRIEQELNGVCHNMRHTRSRSATFAAESLLADPTTAKIIRYKFLLGLSSPEISQLTGLSAEAVRQRVFRLRRDIPALKEMSH